MEKQLGIEIFLFINIMFLSLFLQSNIAYKADMVVILNCFLVALALRRAISIKNLNERDYKPSWQR
jgi:hypothetical protein